MPAQSKADANETAMKVVDVLRPAVEGRLADIKASPELPVLTIFDTSIGQHDLIDSANFAIMKRYAFVSTKGNKGKMKEWSSIQGTRLRWLVGYLCKATSASDKSDPASDLDLLLEDIYDDDFEVFSVQSEPCGDDCEVLDLISDDEGEVRSSKSADESDEELEVRLLHSLTVRCELDSARARDRLPKTFQEPKQSKLDTPVQDTSDLDASLAAAFGEVQPQLIGELRGCVA
ncbi:unnamed protein product [Symbiodinium microadriaticum]|nr:unnamed protein product [Symbiodinium microadriaticum]